MINLHLSSSDVDFIVEKLEFLASIEFTDTTFAQKISIRSSAHTTISKLKNYSTPYALNDNDLKIIFNALTFFCSEITESMANNPDLDLIMNYDTYISDSDRLLDLIDLELGKIGMGIGLINPS